MTASSQIPGALPPEEPATVSTLQLRAITEPATPVQAAVGVIAAAMGEGHATAREIAQAEEDAGLLIDPQAMQDVADAAREQAQAEASAELAAVRDELAQAQEQLASLGHFKGQLDGIRSALAGRPDTDLMMVREILHAADPHAATDAPMTLTWSGTVDVPTADADPKRAVVDCVTPYGGRASLVVQGAERLALASLIETEIRNVHAECGTEGCGAQATGLDQADDSMWGWSILQVAGTAEPGRWYCSSMCVVDALARAGAELAEQDERAAGGEL